MRRKPWAQVESEIEATLEKVCALAKQRGWSDKQLLAHVLGWFVACSTESVRLDESLLAYVTNQGTDES